MEKQKLNSYFKKIKIKLNRQIQSIQSLSNKQTVLKLCQLMYRIENVNNRLDILNLLLVSFCCCCCWWNF